MLSAAFEPFVQDAPFCVTTRATLESLFSPERLDQLFRTTAQKQYTRELLFSQLVELMTAVVLQQQPSVLAAYRQGIGRITVSDQSVYNKLDGMELGVSAALVRDSAQRLAPVIDRVAGPPTLVAARLPRPHPRRQSPVRHRTPPAAVARRLGLPPAGQGAGRPGPTDRPGYRRLPHPRRPRSGTLPARRRPRRGGPSRPVDRRPQLLHAEVPLPDTPSPGGLRHPPARAGRRPVGGQEALRRTHRHRGGLRAEHRAEL